MADQLSDSVLKHFDQYASDARWQSFYDMERQTFNYPFKLRQDCFCFFMNKVKPKSILDAGCGSGDFLVGLPPSAEEFLGVDLSKEMIEAAEKLHRDQLKTSLTGIAVKFVVADLLSYVPEKQYDFVIASGLTEYFENIPKTVGKLASFASLGGHVAIQTPNRKCFRWGGKRKIFSREKGFSHQRLSSLELDNIAIKSGLKKVEGRFVSYSIPLVPNTPFLQRSVNAKAAILALKPLSEKLAAMYIALYEKVEE